MNAATPWARGRFDRRAAGQALLFGRMYEDHGIECAAFAPGTRVFAIASAGDTARALADTRDVVAVDINPVQLDYARARLAGAPARVGTAERVMALGRRLLPLVGWTRARLAGFLALDDPARQLEAFRAGLDTRRYRLAADLAFSLLSLGRVYDRDLLSIVPPRFGAVMRGRLERTIARHPNRDNPWLRALLLGEFAPPAPPPARAVELHCADALAFLGEGAPARFDAFTLSNITDGTSGDFQRRLWAAVRHAARPGALVVRRSFREPGPGDDPRWQRAADDRSVLWGVVDVRPVEAL